MSRPNSVPLFDELADQYDQVLPFFSTFGRVLVDFVAPTAGSRVLDIAAGRGAVAIPAAERGCDVVAIDGSPRMVDVLKREARGVEALVMDAHHLAFDDDTFDVALMAFAIHCVVDPVAVVREAARVVRPGGEVVMTVPGPYSHAEQWERFHHLGDDLERRPGVGDTSQPTDLPAVFAEAGLKDVREDNLEIALPVESAEQLWAFQLSHGFAGHVRTFMPADRVRFEQRAMRELDALVATEGFMLRRGVVVCTAQLPLVQE